MKIRHTPWPALLVGCVLYFAGCPLGHAGDGDPAPPAPVEASAAQALPAPTASRAEPPPDGGLPAAPPGPRPVAVWGLAGLRGYAFGEEVAPNGLEFNQLFSLDLDFNVMLWRDQGLYLFSDARFWGQKPGAGVTNANQGIFDFSKREFDFTLGAAWNYYGRLEARVFAYSDNNLNRGSSLARPTGYNDGVGLENRYYLGPTYANLGTEAFDVARATFVSLGYYPTKDLMDNIGMTFKPGPFARAYLTFDLFSESYYLYLDTQLIGDRTFQPKLWEFDGGLALRPFASHPRLEFRVGSENRYDVQWHDFETSLYVALRYVY
jgi:hypothetical protein